MTGSNRANRVIQTFVRNGSIAALLIASTGCAREDAAAKVMRSPVTLTIAFGLTTGQTAQSGLRAAVANIVTESLVLFSKEGRPQARMADRWTISPDGLLIRLHLRGGISFHDGTSLTAEAIQASLSKSLKDYLGPAFEDISSIHATSPVDLELALKRRSSFVQEALDVVFQAPGSPASGPFRLLVASEEGAELAANDTYYNGRPAIDKISIKPYTSVRAAWADMLRGRVDMLYEVGADAIEILQPSKAVQVISHLRNYQIIGMLNVRQGVLKDPAFRRALNAGIDRGAVVADALKGHGIPAEGAVWPSNWAYDSSAPMFRYDPRTAGADRATLSCILGDAALERLALTLQQQLQRIGVDLRCELLTVDKTLERVAKGEFDVFLADTQAGPTLLQTYRNWRTGARRNMGGYSSARVDAIFDQINASATDDEYHAGVAALQRAIYEDPPAIFIAWSERARAVSTRFEVPIEPGRDILGTLRQWKPVPDQILAASRN